MTLTFACLTAVFAGCFVDSDVESAVQALKPSSRCSISPGSRADKQLPRPVLLLVVPIAVAMTEVAHSPSVAECRETSW